MSACEARTELIWNLHAVNKLFQRLEEVWASSLGLSLSQWSILMAIRALDVGNGISIAEVTKRLRIESSYITTQSKFLELNGYVNRSSSLDDRRIVLLSLSQDTVVALAGLNERQQSIYRFVFKDMLKDEMSRLLKVIRHFDVRLSKAALMLAVGEDMFELH